MSEAPDIVLVRPENPANVGAVARVMRNTGLTRLVLVAPGDFRTVDCWRSAWGAHDVLETLVEHADLPAALAHYDHTVAFSGRASAEHPAADVRMAAQRFARFAPRVRAAFVFGPETAGLSEDELRLCGARAFIPAHPGQPSLNLSHAVLVATYEFYRASLELTGAGDDDAQDPDTRQQPSRAEREAFLGPWRDALIAAGALASDDTRYFPRWQDFFRRAELSARELRLFEHLANKLAQLQSQSRR
jgi:tRNA (cytidine32/uridine32-2'-O)-methyltransferase